MFSSPSYLGPMLISFQFNQLGIKLKKRQIRKLAKQFEDLSNGFSISLNDRQIKKSNTSSKEELIEKGNLILKNLGSMVEKYEKGFQSIIMEFVEEYSDAAFQSQLEYLFSSFKRERAKRKRSHKSLKSSISNNWSDPLNKLEMMKFIMDDIFYGLIEREDIDDTIKNTILIHILSKGCQLLAEILVLLKAGFADGAYNRWRSLHELSVIALIIADSDEIVAKRYFDHESVNIFREASEFKKYKEKYGGEGISQESIQDAESNYNSVIEQYGNDFRNDYGWASALLQKKRPTLKDLEQFVELDYLRGHYLRSSNSLHPSVRGLFFRLGLPDIDDHYLLNGPSDVGLEDPCYLASTSTYMIATAVLNNVNNQANMDSIVFAKILGEINNQISDSTLRN